jgi:Icc protein
VLTADLPVSDPTLLVQLSDPHLGATWAGADPAADLAAAVESVRRLKPAPDAVVVSGDLANGAADAEYERARALLEPLGAAIYVLPGNHDDRAALRRHFDVSGVGDAPIQYTVDIGALRLVVLDSTVPGEVQGRLDPDRLGWLDAELTRAPDAPTLIAMHHPPLWTGMPAADEIGLAAQDRRALGAILGRHPQVRRVVAGHVHRTIVSDLAGRAVLAAPSTTLAGRLDFISDEFELTAEPPGFAVHAFLDGELVSHVQPVL